MTTHAERLSAARSRASHSGRGKPLEQLLELTHRRYERTGVAYVQRNGVPFVPQRRAPGYHGKPLGTACLTERDLQACGGDWLPHALAQHQALLTTRTRTA